MTRSTFPQVEENRHVWLDRATNLISWIWFRSPSGAREAGEIGGLVRNVALPYVAKLRIINFKSQYWDFS